MGSMTIRNIDDNTKKRLRMRAAEHGHSMEEEVREILNSALAHKSSREIVGLGEAIRRRFAPLGGMDLKIPPRGPLRKPPDFSK